MHYSRQVECVNSRSSVIRIKIFFVHPLQIGKAKECEVQKGSEGRGGCGNNCDPGKRKLRWVRLNADVALGNQANVCLTLDNKSSFFQWLPPRLSSCRSDYTQTLYLFVKSVRDH